MDVHLSILSKNHNCPKYKMAAIFKILMKCIKVYIIVNISIWDYYKFDDIYFRTRYEPQCMWHHRDEMQWVLGSCLKPISRQPNTSVIGYCRGSVWSWILTRGNHEQTLGVIFNMDYKRGSDIIILRVHIWLTWFFIHKMQLKHYLYSSGYIFALFVKMSHVIIHMRWNIYAMQHSLSDWHILNLLCDILWTQLVLFPSLISLCMVWLIYLSHVLQFCFLFHRL